MKKNLITLIIILIILLGILIYFFNKLSNSSQINAKSEGVLNLSGFGVFFDKYSGEFKSSEIAADLEDLTIEYIPKIYNNAKKLKDNKMEEYYNESKNRIKKEIGINDYSEFSVFINALKETKIDLDTWYRLDIITESFIDDSDKIGYSYFEYEVSFKNDEKIKFSAYVSKRKSKTPNYIIKVIEN